MNSGSLLLSLDTFKILFDELVQAFEEEYDITVNQMRRFQLFGYGTFDPEEPNLKTFIYLKTGYWVNGKYLYMKLKEYESGEEVIKLTREFVYVYFRTLDYKDVSDFLNNSPHMTEDVKKKQLAVLGAIPQEIQEEYYVGYYLGEEQSFIKTTLTIFNNWKEVVWNLVYWDSPKQPTFFEYRGWISLKKNRLTFIFKNMVSHHIERYVQICLFWSQTLPVKPYLLGVYSGFDWNDCPVAGEIIFQRVVDQQEQERIVLDKKINPIIADRLLGKRITTESILPQSFYDLTPNSQYVTLLDRFAGNYSGFVLTFEGSILHIELKIRQTNQRSDLKLGRFWTLQGYFKIRNNAEFLTCRFLDGNHLHEVNVVLLTNPLESGYLHGSINGVDTNNKPFNGKVYITNQSTEAEKVPAVLPEGLTSETDLEQLPRPIVQHLTEWIQNFQSLDRQLKQTAQAYEVSAEGNGLSELKGCYVSYYLDAVKKHLYKDILLIHANGQTELKSNICTLRGSAVRLQNGILIISVGNHDNSSHFQQITTFVGHNSREDFEYLPAILASHDKSFRPIAVKLFLFKEENDFASLSPEIYPVTEKQKLKHIPAEVLTLLTTKTPYIISSPL